MWGPCQLDSQCMVMVVIYPVSVTNHLELDHGLSSILTWWPRDRKDILSIILLHSSHIFKCSGGLVNPPNHETDMAHKLVHSMEIILGLFQKNMVVLQYENVVMDDLMCEFFYEWAGLFDLHVLPQGDLPLGHYVGREWHIVHWCLPHHWKVPEPRISIWQFAT